MVTRDRLCDHVADRYPGQPGRTRRHHPRSLDDRGPAPLGDVNFDEDRSQIRTASGPPGHGHLAITILRLAGHASIAAALRHHARRPERPLRTIMKC